MQRQTFYPQGQQNQQIQQTRMQQPPTTISTKDLLYLKDAMSWELTAMKKCYEFAQECNIDSIKQTIQRAGKMHEKHYQRLLNQFNNNTSNVQPRH